MKFRTRPYFQSVKSLKRSSAAGQAMIEFALMFPIFMLLFVGLIGLGIVLFTYVTTSNAAREGARFVIAHPQATDTQVYTHICATSPGLGGTEAGCMADIHNGELIILIEPAPAGRVPQAQVSVTVRRRVPVPTVSTTFLDGRSFTFLGPIWVSSVSVMRIE